MRFAEKRTYKHLKPSEVHKSSNRRQLFSRHVISKKVYVSLIFTVLHFQASKLVQDAPSTVYTLLDIPDIRR